MNGGEADKIERNERTNTLELLATSRQIRTLEDLLEACRVDLDIWRVDHHIVNAWGVTMRGPDGDPVDAMNFQVKAWMVRREPIAIMPTIQPIKVVRGTLRASVGRALRDVRTALILPDAHFGFERDMRDNRLNPFHDRLALDVAMQISKAIEPDVVIWLGDMLDLPDFTDKFLRRPGFYWTVQSAIIDAHWWLNKFRQAAPNARHYLIEGNHDKRIEKAILERLAVAYDLRSADQLDRPPTLSIPGLLALDQLNVEYVGDYPDGRVWLNNGLVCEHGARIAAGSGMTARKVVENTDVNVIFGHAHRRETAGRTIHGRRRQWSVEAICPGTLCRTTGEVPAQSKNQNWQQGIAVAYYTDTAHTIYTIPITDGRAIFDGALYTGRDRVKEMVKDTNWPAFISLSGRAV